MAFNEKEQQLIRWGVQNGKTPQDIETAVASMRAGYTAQPPLTQEPKEAGFVDGIKQDFSKRVDEAATSQMQAIDGTRSNASAVGRTLGAGGRFIGDLGSRTLSAITPDAVGDVAIQGVQNIAGSKAGQAIGSAYQSAKKANPELVEGVEDVLSVGSSLLAPGAANATAKATLNVAGRSTQALGGITQVGSLGIKEAASKAVNPELLMQRVARISKGKQAAFEERAGESVGKYLVNRQIFGDVDQITTQLYDRLQKSKGEVDTAFASLPGEFKNTAVGSALKELSERERKISGPGAISKDKERVQALLKKHSGSGLNMKEVNEVKRLYERNVRLDYLKENVPTNVERANNIDRSIREWQQTKASQLGFKNVQELNRETYLAKQLLDDLGAEYAGSAANNAVSLTDWVLLAGTSADPATAIGSFIAKKTLSSKPVLSKIAKIFSRGKQVPEPKAKMEPATIDNYINFLKKTTQPNIDIDEPIKDYVKGMQPGLSMKSSVTPEAVSGKIDARDATRLNAYAADPYNANTFVETQDLLEQIGIQNAEIETQVRFIKEVLQLWDARK